MNEKAYKNRRYHPSVQKLTSRITPKIKNQYQTILNQKLLKVSAERGASSWDQLQNLIKEAVVECNTHKNDRVRHNLPEYRWKVVKKREALRKQHKSICNKSEFNAVRKLIRKPLRIHNRERMNMMIAQIIETTKSTKTIKKDRALGKNT